MPDASLVVRWLHFLAGITWIGLLYFLNLVNVRFAASLDASVRPTIVPPLLSRVLAWFRHSAWLTVLVGLILFYLTFVGADGSVKWDEPRVKTILIGGLLGIIMALNVWVFIWPNQKKIIAAMRAGQPPDPSWGRTALYASRTNFTLSFPMLLFMGHSAVFDWGGIIIFGLIAAAIGAVVVFTVQKWWAPKF